MSFRTSLAISCAKASYHLLRLCGREGRALPGKLALKLDPQVISHLSAGHKSIVITGTNGKTTTTHIVQQAIINEYGGASYDPTSTNMEQGVATTLCLDSSVSGKRLHNWAIIESDEGAAKRLVPALKPDVIIVTNLFRDQIDRFPTWTTARDYLIEAIHAWPQATVVLNADCQVSASIADQIDNPILWFGADCDIYAAGIADFDEEVACVNCGAQLEFQHRSFAHLGDYRCPHCGRVRPKPHFALLDLKVLDDTHCTLTVEVEGADAGNIGDAGKGKGTTASDTSVKRSFSANIRAGYDAYNALAALSGLRALGLSQEATELALKRFVHAAHRFEIFNVNGTPTRLLLVKNTAGANQVVNMLASESSPADRLAFLLGNEIMDGSSTDWIQEVRWEKIIAPETQLYVGGPCYRDMKARLEQIDAPHQAIHEQPNYAALIQMMAESDQPITVIANCSTIEALRCELKKHYQPIDYWSNEAPDLPSSCKPRKK